MSSTTNENDKAALPAANEENMATLPANNENENVEPAHADQVPLTDKNEDENADPQDSSWQQLNKKLDDIQNSVVYPDPATEIEALKRQNFHLTQLLSYSLLDLEHPVQSIKWNQDKAKTYMYMLGMAKVSKQSVQMVEAQMEELKRVRSHKGTWEVKPWWQFW